MKTKNKKLLSILIFIGILLTPMGVIFGDETYFDSFNPPNGCGGCHPTANPESVTGYIALSSSAGINVSPSDTFTIETQVLLFTEASGETVTIGFLAGVDSNAQFTFNATQVDGVGVNATGNTTKKWFGATAPTTPGVYVVTPYAVEGMNDDLNWAEGSLTINVVAFVTDAATLQAPTIDELKVTLNWDSIVNSTIYHIYRDTSPILSVAGLTPIGSTNATTYQDTVPAEGNYSYAVVAGNYWGSGPLSNSETADVSLPPGEDNTMLVIIVASSIFLITAIFAIAIIIKKSK